jgi:hypothetical protein
MQLLVDSVFKFFLLTLLDLLNTCSKVLVGSILKTPIIIVYLPVSPFNSISFYVHNLHISSLVYI